MFVEWEAQGSIYAAIVEFTNDNIWQHWANIVIIVFTKLVFLYMRREHFKVPSVSDSRVRNVRLCTCFPTLLSSGAHSTFTSASQDVLPMRSRVSLRYTPCGPNWSPSRSKLLVTVHCVPSKKKPEAHTVSSYRLPRFLGVQILRNQQICCCWSSSWWACPRYQKLQTEVGRIQLQLKENIVVFPCSQIMSRPAKRIAAMSFCQACYEAPSHPCGQVTQKLRKKNWNCTTFTRIWFHPL